MVILDNDEYLHEIPAHLMGFHHINKTRKKKKNQLVDVSTLAQLIPIITTITLVYLGLPIKNGDFPWLC